MNGQAYTHNWLSHAALMQGAALDFEMAPVPNTTRGTAAADAPYSFSKPTKTK